MIADTDAPLFRQACRVAEGDPLPDCVVAAYLEFKWARDPIDASPLRAEEVALIVVQSGFAKGKRAGRKQATLADIVRAGKIAEDSPVKVLWKMGHKYAGKYKGYAKVRDRVLVQLDNENEPREFAPEKVVEA